LISKHIVMPSFRILLSWDFLYQFSSNNDNFIYNNEDFRISWHWNNTVAHSGSFSQHGGPASIPGLSIWDLWWTTVTLLVLQCPHLNASAPYSFIMWDTIMAAVQRDWVSCHPMTLGKKKFNHYPARMGI